MKPIVYIFFNGEGVEFPPDNGWEKFKGTDAARTFLICADSWARNGWEVRRLSTGTVNFDPTIFTGRCKPHMAWYPAQYWQFCAKAKSLLQPGEWAMFATMDVINNSLEAEVIAGLPRSRLSLGCYSFQLEHFSMSSIYCSQEWLVEAENILLKYDRGEFPEIRADYISDERILRQFAPWNHFPVQKFACGGGENAPLVHYARSTLARKFQEIPCP